MKVEYGDIIIYMNNHAYKGKCTISEGKTIEAYFFDAKASQYGPSHAYIMYQDENEGIKILPGTNEIDDLFKFTTEMTDVQTEELTSTYFQMLLDYILQESLDITPPVPGKPIYIENVIVQEIEKKSKTRNRA